MVRGADYAVVRARPGHAELIAQERMPEWLDGPEEVVWKATGRG
jgi:hypothetical protein